MNAVMFFVSGFSLGIFAALMFSVFLDWIDERHEDNR